MSRSSGVRAVKTMVTFPLRKRPKSRLLLRKLNSFYSLGPRYSSRCTVSGLNAGTHTDQYSHSASKGLEYRTRAPPLISNA